MTIVTRRAGYILESSVFGALLFISKKVSKCLCGHILEADSRKERNATV